MDDAASAYAQHLLDSLGGEPLRPIAAPEEHPAIAWARSGLMALTGPAGGAPQMCPVPLAACADGALAALASLAPAGALDGLRGSFLLAERAAIAGFTRAGAASPGGSCRLLEAADGWIAVNLVREDDWALLPAWLECPGEPGWHLVRGAVQSRSAGELVERGRELGLAVCEARYAGEGSTPWFSDGTAADHECASPSGRGRAEGAGEGRSFDGVRTPSTQRPSPLAPLPEGEGESAASARISRREAAGRAFLAPAPKVIDLSSLWAGPLCGHLLQLMGADVIKVESTHRPDGARFGPPAFYDLLNAGKRSVALDLRTPAGHAQLRALIAGADIVIEASRPRALRQMGILAEDLLERRPRLTWISINGYGRGEPQGNWVAYGDDAGVAAGLSELMHRATGQRLICGDAVADPLTGLHAALAAWCGHLQGGGRLIALALRDVVRHCIEFDLPSSTAALRARQLEWSALAAARCPPAPPRARTACGKAAALGADTAGVLGRP